MKNPDELHIIKILSDKKPSVVKSGCNASEYCCKDTGTPQRDWARANKSTHYLSKSLASICTFTPTDYSCMQQEICTAVPDKPSKHNRTTNTQINDIILNIEHSICRQCF